MSEIFQSVKSVSPHAGRSTDELFALVYRELRALAAQRMLSELPGQTLQPTALVNEAYLRLVGAGTSQVWQTRGHFFASAAESMRRILIDNARRKKRLKHGGGRLRIELDDDLLVSSESADELLAIDKALEKLAHEMPEKAELVKLRFFAGCTIDEAADLLEISRSTAKRHWTFARAWLQSEIASDR
jgi:RNA polymerase sigma factor (TIGR02999 family)